MVSPLVAEELLTLSADLLKEVWLGLLPPDLSLGLSTPQAIALGRQLGSFGVVSTPKVAPQLEAKAEIRP